MFGSGIGAYKRATRENPTKTIRDDDMGAKIMHLNVI